MWGMLVAGGWLHGCIVGRVGWASGEPPGLLTLLVGFHRAREEFWGFAFVRNY